MKKTKIENFALSEKEKTLSRLCQYAGWSLFFRMQQSQVSHEGAHTIMNNQNTKKWHFIDKVMQRNGKYSVRLCLFCIRIEGKTLDKQIKV